MLYGHVFRNAMLIVIAGFPAVFISVFFGGSLIIETIFSLDGLGRLAYESAIQRDYPVVFGTLYVFGLLGLVVGLLSDLTYVWVDPRIDFETPRDLMRAERPCSAAAWPNFKANRRAPSGRCGSSSRSSVVTLCAEFVANDRPLAGPLPGRVALPGASASTPRPTSAASSRPRPSTTRPRCAA